MLEQTADLIDRLAFVVLTFGIVLSVWMSADTYRKAQGTRLERLSGPALIMFRITLGRWMLTGLEILIVSDILHSIAHRTLEEVALLAVIVVIRVVMAYFLDLELRRLEAD